MWKKDTMSISSFSERHRPEIYLPILLDQLELQENLFA